MNLVIWTHEHECRIDVDESLVGTFRISQPGSTVATKLNWGEAMRKHCGLIEVRGNQFRMMKIPLGSVRSFAWGGIISLKNFEGILGGVLDVENPEIEEMMFIYLADFVGSLVRSISTLDYLVSTWELTRLFVLILGRFRGHLSRAKDSKRRSWPSTTP